MNPMGTSRLIRATAGAAASGVLIAAAATCALARDSAGLSEMKTAEQRAAAAAQARDVEHVKKQLQQALNCLVGSQGTEYRSEAGDPCEGRAALRRLPEGSVNKIRVEKAIRLLTVGVTFHDFKPAHYTAAAVQAVLEEGVGP